jgi:hypothetical protein
MSQIISAPFSLPSLRGVINAPVVLADFNDLTKWTEFNDGDTLISRAAAGASFQLNGGAVSDQTHIAGLMARGIAYPNPTTGALVIRSVWDTYTGPTDIANNRNFNYGHSQIAILSGDGHWGVGWGGLDAGGLNRGGLWSFVSTGTIVGENIRTKANPPPTAFTLTTYYGWYPGQLNWCLWKIMYTLNGVPSVPGTDELGASRKTAYFSNASGWKIGIRNLYSTRSVLARARCTSLEIIDGCWLSFQD